MGLDLSTLIQPADTRIVLVVMDGLGGYADATRGSELEEATTPNLDRLAAQGSVGLVEPVGPGITPGSGPGHLGLFGYDPLKYELGRGALSAAGLDVELKPGDVAARGNLATLDGNSNVTDRRAGRIPDDEAAAVVEKLRDGIGIEGVEVAQLGEHWDRFDYFFLHHKYPDSAGEDGDFDRKVAAIETLDAAIPAIAALGPDVIVVTGDHSTPSQMAAHSWHPVPALMWGDRVGRDDTDRFGERWCRRGALGLRPTRDLMPLALAAAGRLAKYGA